MGNIAAYQEGFTDGYDTGKEKTKEKILSMLKAFYNDNYEPEEIAEQSEFIKGYDMALNNLIEVLNDIEKEIKNG